MINFIANFTTVLILANSFLFFSLYLKIKKYHIKTEGFDFLKILTLCIAISQFFFFTGRLLAFNLGIMDTKAQLQSYMLLAYLPIFFIGIYLLKKFKHK